MWTYLINAYLLPTFVFFLGGMALLFVHVLANQPNRLGRISTWVGGFVFLGAAWFGVIGAALNLPAQFWVPCLTLGCMYLIFFALPSTPGKTFLAALGRMLGSPRGRFAAIFVVSIAGVAGSLVYSINALAPPPLFVPPCDETALEPRLEEVAWAAARTDLGHPIALRTNVGPAASQMDAAALENQEKLLARVGLEGQVIHLPSGWQNTNCHGWVFTGGLFWVSSDQVDQILKDNRYHPVAQAQPGDLAVYRDADSGQVTHTGIVRYLGSGNHLILVESKWGAMGRFLHPHDTHCYVRDECTFYRSSRSGHRLHGLPSESQPRQPGPDGSEYNPLPMALPL